MDTSIQKYLTIVKTIEYGSFTKAAEVLSYSQSGIIRIGTFSSVVTHWLPNIIKAFQKDYPNIDYELLLGDYTEIEKWIAEGRVDCGFLRLPIYSEFDTIFLEQDNLMAIIPEDYPLADCEKFLGTAVRGTIYVVGTRRQSGSIRAVREEPSNASCAIHHMG